MDNVVYVLCAATSLACALMLWSGYRRYSERLLFWGSLCFSLLFVNNLMLVVDVNYPPVDLALWRSIPGLGGISILLYGLIWEVER